MNKILLSLVVVFISATYAFAEWQVDFRDTYFDQGIDQAVKDALEVGENPYSITELGIDLIENDGLNAQNLVMALYCAGAKGQDIRDAAGSHGISDEIVTAGYKKSVVECTDAVADSQAYTPVTSGLSGGRSGGITGATFATTYRFQ